MLLSHLVVQGIAIRAPWGPHFLTPEVEEILGQPGLCHLGSVGRGPILQEDIGAPPDHLFHQRLDHIPHDIHKWAFVHPHISSQPHHGPPLLILLCSSLVKSLFISSRESLWRLCWFFAYQYPWQHSHLRAFLWGTVFWCLKLSVLGSPRTGKCLLGSGTRANIYTLHPNALAQAVFLEKLLPNVCYCLARCLHYTEKKFGLSLNKICYIKDNFLFVPIYRTNPVVCSINYVDLVWHIYYYYNVFKEIF